MRHQQTGRANCWVLVEEQLFGMLMGVVDLGKMCSLPLDFEDGPHSPADLQLALCSPTLVQVVPIY